MANATASPTSQPNKCRACSTPLVFNPFPGWHECPTCEREAWAPRSVPSERLTRDAARRAAESDYRHELRRLRRTQGGTVPPSPASLYAAVVASGPCAYCNAPATAADHVRPLADGGADNVTNLAPACGPCNQSKADKVLSRWDPARVAHGVRHSATVAVEWARLTGQPAAPLLS